MKKSNLKFIKISNKLKKLDKLSLTLISIVLFLTAFGVLMVYSASFYSAKRNYNNEYFFLIKQLTGFVLGLISLIIVSKINYNYLQKFVFVFLILSFILLILVFVPSIGVENYGARRWIALPGFTIQPSEIAKFSFVLFASWHLSKNHTKVKSLKGILPVIIIGGLFCLLIILEPNMSITMCIGIVLILMLIVGGISFKHLLFLIIPALLLVPVLIIIEPYRFKRLLAFINPWASPKEEGYQLIQSFFSISSGGVFGVGLFNSRQKFLFLPFSESDFIFSIIAEELGLIGAIFILLMFIILIFCGIKISLNAKNRFGCYLSAGITLIIAVQTMLNIAVVTGMIPPTGLPLPFISSGSTSLVVFMSAIGVLLNINKQNKNSKIEIKDIKPFKFVFKFNKNKKKTST